MKNTLITLLAVASLAFAGTASVFAATERCPDGGTKVEANGGTQDAINETVLEEGTLVCVKGSTDATGIIVADGESTLEELLGNGHDVSHYVIYEAEPTPEVTPSPTPVVTPEPSPSTEPTPEPTVTPEPTPVVTPSPEPSTEVTPAPTEEPDQTLPATDMAAGTAEPADAGYGAFLFILLLAGSATLLARFRRAS